MAAESRWANVSRWIVLAVCAASGSAAAEGLDGLLEEGLASGMVGLAVVVDRGGEVVTAGAAGLADVEAGRALTVDDAIHLASFTKQFTAAAALRLVESGRLGLDDRIADWLGEERLAGLPYADEVTVRLLLEHRTGFYATNNDPTYIEAWLGDGAGESATWTADDFLRLARAAEPVGVPGGPAQYGDLNYILLAEVVAEAAGQPFRDHVRETIFEPFELDSAYFFSEVGFDDPIPGGTAHGYLVLSDVIDEIVDLNEVFPRVEGMARTTAAGERIEGAGAIVASVLDAHRFADAYFRGPLLDAESRALAFSVLGELTDERDSVQGILRAYRLPEGDILTAEGDGPGGCHSLMAYHPPTDTLVVALTNTFGLWTEAGFLRETLMGSAVRQAGRGR